MDVSAFVKRFLVEPDRVTRDYLSSEEQVIIAGCQHSHLRYRLMDRDTVAPEAQLVAYAKDSSRTMVERLVTKDPLHEDLQRVFARDPAARVRMRLASNQSITPKTQDILFKEPETRRRLAANRGTRLELLEQLVGVEDCDVGLAQNDSISDEIALQLTQSRSVLARVYLATQQERLGVEVVEKLSFDPEESVQASLQRNLKMKLTGGMAARFAATYQPVRLEAWAQAEGLDTSEVMGLAPSWSGTLHELEQAIELTLR